MISKEMVGRAVFAMQEDSAISSLNAFDRATLGACVRIKSNDIEVQRNNLL